MTGVQTCALPIYRIFINNGGSYSFNSGSNCLLLPKGSNISFADEYWSNFNDLTISGWYKWDSFANISNILRFEILTSPTTLSIVNTVNDVFTANKTNYVIPSNTYASFNYNTDLMTIPAGTYNITFSTGNIGIGSTYNDKSYPLIKVNNTIVDPLFWYKFDDVNVVAKKYQILYANVGSYTFTVPDLVSSIDIVCIGGGGGGCHNFWDDGAGGGGGGLVWANSISVSSGQQYNITVGAGGANTQNGGNTSFSGNGINIIAYGGGGSASDIGGAGEIGRAHV